MQRKLAITLSALAAATMAFAGCSSSGAHHAAAGRAPAARQLMTMADGSVMDAADMGAAGVRSHAAAPSKATAMICNAETHDAIAEVLHLRGKPASSSSWANDVYTCTYRLPIGRFVVSVKQSADDAAAREYFTAARARFAPTENLYGIGAAAYGNRSGIVVLIKDNDTLTVDASRLPAVFGAQHNKRYDFAYEIASDILGCWTGG
jgi:hypothetical protein